MALKALESLFMGEGMIRYYLMTIGAYSNLNSFIEDKIFSSRSNVSKTSHPIQNRSKKF